MFFNTTGSENVAIGEAGLIGNVTGSFNVALGGHALANALGASNIAVGRNAGFNSTLTTSNNNIYIGNVGADESGAIRIGTLGTHTTCFVQGINGVAVGTSSPVLVNAVGQLGTLVSSRRFKHDIADMGDDSANILDLHPVTFAYNSDATETKQYGLIAEEVEQVFPAIVVKDADGNPYTVQYHVLPVLLLNELIKQEAKFSTALERINNRLAALEQHN